MRKAAFTPLLLAIAACVMIDPVQGGDGGSQAAAPDAGQGASGVDPGDGGLSHADGGPAEADGGSLSLDPGWTFPPAPVPIPDDPTTCTGIVPHPELGPEPDRPCTEDLGDRFREFRYDPSGRLVYRVTHEGGGREVYPLDVYTLDDDGGTRTETVVVNTHVTSVDVTRLKDGRPVESDHFSGDVSGASPLQFAGHTTWLYDGNGRQQYVISSVDGRGIERDFYDGKGRLYFVDHPGLPPRPDWTWDQWTLRTWYANGSLASEVTTCGAPPTGDASLCGRTETKWDTCGNLIETASATVINGGTSSSTTWTWSAQGTPLNRRDLSNTSRGGSSTLESYQVDGTGRASSSLLAVSSSSAVVYHQALYQYDSAGHTTERLVDGNSDFHASFDPAGRLMERIGPGGLLVGRWTYDGCGR